MENRETPPHQALVLIRSNPVFFARQGYLATKWRGSGTDRRGPYYALRFHHDGRLRSIYLGRDGPLVQQVRALLAQLEEPLRRQREYKKSRRQLMSVLRGSNANLCARLGAIGLRMKGREIRGWRNLRFS